MTKKKTGWSAVHILSLGIDEAQNNIDTFPPKYNHEGRLTSLQHLSTKQNFYQPLVNENTSQTLFNDNNVQSVSAVQKKKKKREKQGYCPGCWNGQRTTTQEERVRRRKKKCFCFAGLESNFLKDRLILLFIFYFISQSSFYGCFFLTKKKKKKTKKSL